MLLPFRAKNRPERFPFVTLGLMVANLLIYVATADQTSPKGAFLTISEPALKNYALYHDTLFSEPWRILSSMFLHGNIEHILGNMLFLWLFGASVEGRLKPIRFLILYLVAGAAGDLLEDLLWGALHPGAPSLGASGAIMGLAGAYLFAFPYSFISVFYMLGLYRVGVRDIQARWLVLLYIGLDILSAFLFRGRDGVGHLAHIGGFGMGLLLAFLLRMRRDSEEVSYAKSAQAEGGYAEMDVSELEVLLEQPTEDMKLVMTYCAMVVEASSASRYARCLSLIYRYINPLMIRYPSDQMARLLLGIPPAAGGIALAIYLRIAAQLERSSQNDLALQLYRHVDALAPTAPDTEAALYRQAQMMQNIYKNTGHANALYTEMLRRFPNGNLSQEARRALQQMGSNVGFYRGGPARLGDDEE